MLRNLVNANTILQISRTSIMNNAEIYFIKCIYIYVCVCVCVCVYICMYDIICIYIYICVCVCVCVWGGGGVISCICAGVHVCAHVCVRMKVLLFVKVVLTSFYDII